MSVLIKGGRIVTAADDYVGDVFVENGTVSLHRRVARRPGGQGRRRRRQVTSCRARIDPHTHLEMFFGGTITCDDFTSGTVSAAFGGTTDARRLLHAGARHVLRPGARELPREDRPREAGDRRRLPHRRSPTCATAARSRSSRRCPTRASPRTSCSWPTRAPSWSTTRRSSRRMQAGAETGALVMVHAENGDAIDVLVKEARRRRADGAEVARAHAPARDRGRGDEPRDPARARRRRAALRRPRLLQGVDRPDRPRPRERLEQPGARPARSTCSSTSRHLDKPELRGRASGSTRRRRAPKEHQEHLWHALRNGRALGGLHRPLPVQLDGPEGRSAARTSRRSRTAAPASRTGSTCSTTTASAQGRITLNRIVELLSPNAGPLLRALPAQGHDRDRARTPTSWSWIPRRS